MTWLPTSKLRSSLPNIRRWIQVLRMIGRTMASRSRRKTELGANMMRVVGPAHSLCGLRHLDLHRCAGLELVGTASHDFIAGLQIPEHLDQWPGRQAHRDVDPFCATASYADHKRAARGARDTAVGDEE